MQVQQYIRDDGPESHLSKAGTPTMGGLLIVFSIVASTLLWSDLTNYFVWIMLFVVIGYGLVGFVDDYLMQETGGRKSGTPQTDDKNIFTCKLHQIRPKDPICAIKAVFIIF